MCRSLFYMIALSTVVISSAAELSAQTTWTQIPFIASGSSVTVAGKTITATWAEGSISSPVPQYFSYVNDSSVLCNGMVTLSFSSPIAELKVTTFAQADGEPDTETVTVTGYNGVTELNSRQWTNSDITEYFTFSTQGATSVTIKQVADGSAAGGTGFYFYIPAAPTDIPFDSFEVKLSRNNGQPGFNLQSKFVLGKESEGFDLSKDDVEFFVGEEFHCPIPAGSFVPAGVNAWSYVYNAPGKKGSTIKVTINRLSPQAFAWSSIVSYEAIPPKKSTTGVMMAIGNNLGVADPVRIR